MIALIKDIGKALTHLIYPNLCEGCSSEIKSSEVVCSECYYKLPFTNYTLNNTNPVAKIFFGRSPINAATSCFYFSKDSLIQYLITQLKYKNNKEVGMYLGELLGIAIKNNVTDIDAIIALPLHTKKEFKRGYNQALIIAKGVEKIIEKPILVEAVARAKNTETQTHKNRLSRWENMEDVFTITNSTLLKNKHILLIDDVITTGATLESCANTILKEPTCKVSIASVAHTF